MQENKDQDKNLDIPSEANTQKHINFMDAENGNVTRSREEDQQNAERKEQWQEGLREGQNSNMESSGMGNRNATEGSGGEEDTIGIP